MMVFSGTRDEPLIIDEFDTMNLAHRTAIQQRHGKDHVHLLFVITALLLFAAAFGSIHLHPQPFWNDEWISLRYAGGDIYGPMTFTDIWTRIANANTSQAPAYYFLVAIWGYFAGWTPFALRALSWLMGMLTIVWTYRAAAEIHSRTAGLWAAFSMATCGFFIYYFHEARMYTMTPMLTAVCMWAYARSLRKPSMLTWVLLCVSACALPYTHHVAVLIPVAIGGYHIAFAPRAGMVRRWWIVFAALIAAGILYLPWLGVTLKAGEVVRADSSSAMNAKLPQVALSNVLYLFSNGTIPLLVVVAAFARGSHRLLTLPWVVFIAAMLGAILINLIVPFLYGIRYVIVVFPVLALIFGMGSARLLANLRRAKLIHVNSAIVGAWLIGGLWTASSPTAFREAYVIYLRWDMLAESLAEFAAPKDRVVFMLPYDTPRWIHNAPLEYYLYGLHVDPVMVESLRVFTLENYEQQRRLAFLGAPERVWVTHSPAHPPGEMLPPIIFSHLAENFVMCENRLVDEELQGELFAKAPSDQPLYLYTNESESLRVQLAFSELPKAVQAGEQALDMTLFSLVPPELPPYTYSAGVHVYDGNGVLVAQQDFPLPAYQPPVSGVTGCRPVTLPIRQLPRGTYTIRAYVYAWESDVRWTNNGQDHAVIGVLEIQ